jgi:flagellar biosynthesis protein FlhB
MDVVPLLAGLLLTWLLLEYAFPRLMKSLRRMLRKVFGTTFHRHGIIAGIWASLILCVIALQLLLVLIPLLAATAHLWGWVVLIPLMVVSRNVLVRLRRARRGQPRRTPLPGRWRWFLRRR